jgi:hypothetical protein
MSLFGQAIVGPDTLNQFSEFLYLNPDSNTEEGTKMFVQGVDMTVKALVDDRTPEETQRRAARALFNPDNRMFLRHWSGVTNATGMSQREQLYYHIITPGVIGTMSNLKSLDSDAWQNFYTWSIDESFDVLFKTDIDQIVADRDLEGVTFNNQTNLFELKAKPTQATRGSEDTRRVEQKAHDRHWQQTKSTLTKINRWIKRAQPIMEAEGIPVGEQLRRVFETRGFTNMLNLMPIEEDVDNEGKKKGTSKTE